jgi:hypothetical protein
VREEAQLKLRVPSITPLKEKKCQESKMGNGFKFRKILKIKRKAGSNGTN